MINTSILFHFIFCLLICWGGILTDNAEGGIKVDRLENIYEPSGVVQLKNGDIAIIEDEPDDPIQLVELNYHKSGLRLVRKTQISLDCSYDDFEGITLQTSNIFYFVTSHNKRKKGGRPKTRRKLVRFDMMDKKGKTVETEALFSPLKFLLQKAGGNAEEMNIEALAFDNSERNLLFGLRSPMIEGRAIIVEMANPEKVLLEADQPRLKIKAQLLTGGGIRALHYDKVGGRFLIACEVERTKGRKEQAIFSWDGISNEVDKVTLPGLEALKNVEGITVVSWQGKNYILMVCDDGNRKKNKGAHYLIVEYPE